MTVISAVLITVLLVLIIVVPAVVILRDVRAGRPDPGYDRT
jgi:hypothetical protein